MIKQKVPHDTMLEEGLIGVLLAVPSLLGEAISLIEAESLHDPLCGAAFGEMLKAYSEGRGVDVQVLAASLGPQFPGLDVRDHLLGMLGREALPTREMVHEYCRILDDMARKRRLIKTGQEVAELGYSEEIPISEAEARALGLLMDASRGGESRGYVPISRVLDSAGEVIVAHLENPREIFGLDSGLKAINAVLGGLQPTDLIVIAGRPSMGKSALASTLALNVARQGKRVAFNCLEMGQTRLTLRFLSSLTGVAAEKIRRGTASAEEKGLVYDGLNDLKMLPILVDCTTDITSTQVAVKIRQIARSKGVDLLVVDYLGLLADKDEREVRRLGNITRILKAIAVDLEIPVVALHQLNRDLEHRASKVPMLADLRDSGRIEEDADVVVMIHREDYQKASEEPVSMCHLFIRKNRDGPTGKFTLAFDKTTLTFRDVERDG